MNRQSGEMSDARRLRIWTGVASGRITPATYMPNWVSYGTTSATAQPV